MKKIGIVSVLNNNYGSLLQAYALQRVLTDNGYENEIILYKKSKLLQIKRLFYFPLFRSILISKLKNIKCRMKSENIYKRVIATRDDTFEKFKKNNFIFSKRYNGMKKLIDACYNYDSVLVGSDQVWHPLNLGSNYYSLIFVPDGINKVSYASSFGVSDIPKYQIKKTTEYLNRMDHLSVRENAGAMIIKKLINKNAQVVVDPTLLVKKVVWDEIKNKNIKFSNYILCYFIGSCEESRKLARKFADEKGLNLIILPHIDEYVKYDEIIGDIFPENIGPSEFINLIENAEYIFTDSFHATVFSIIYRKNFFVFERFKSSDKNSTNSRIYSLLNKLKLDNKICYNYNDIKKSEIEKINYNKIENILQRERENSLAYLNKALEK